jgi:hypothetical protein
MKIHLNTIAMCVIDDYTVPFEWHEEPEPVFFDLQEIETSKKLRCYYHIL